MSGLPPEPPSSDITPERVFSDRRRFLRDAALYTATAAGAGGALLWLTGGLHRARGRPGAAAANAVPAAAAGTYDTTEPKTPFADVTGYNNFYEFGSSKDDPARFAGSLRTRPWTVVVEGEVLRPRTWDVDALLAAFPTQDRVYRMRCVEAWSMVIPWIGIPLGDVLKRFEPTAKAKYVAFRTLLDPKQMPGQRRPVLEWPYREGLRMDEAMHPLTILAFGMYGHVLPNQNGAPLRLVVPWKYGFKGCKSIVAISLVETEPPTTWNISAPNEYGFYSNVNPEVDHPRWSQKTERRIGEFRRRTTLPFNGYGEQVAGLYAGMDLKKYF